MGGLCPAGAGGCAMHQQCQYSSCCLPGLAGWPTGILPARPPAGRPQPLCFTNHAAPQPPSALPNYAMLAGVKRFDDTDTEGYGWNKDGGLNWPGKDVRALAAPSLWGCCSSACGALPCRPVPGCCRCSGAVLLAAAQCCAAPAAAQRRAAPVRSCVAGAGPLCRAHPDPLRVWSAPLQPSRTPHPTPLSCTPHPPLLPLPPSSSQPTDQGPAGPERAGSRVPQGAAHPGACSGGRGRQRRGQQRFRPCAALLVGPQQPLHRAHRHCRPAERVQGRPVRGWACSLIGRAALRQRAAGLSSAVRPACKCPGSMHMSAAHNEEQCAGCRAHQTSTFSLSGQPAVAAAACSPVLCPPSSAAFGSLPPTLLLTTAAAAAGCPPPRTVTHISQAAWAASGAMLLVQQ